MRSFFRGFFMLAFSLVLVLTSIGLSVAKADDEPGQPKCIIVAVEGQDDCQLRVWWSICPPGQRCGFYVNQQWGVVCGCN
jgi:uncharacterized membrane protein